MNLRSKLPSHFPLFTNLARILPAFIYGGKNEKKNYPIDRKEIEDSFTRSK